MSECVVTKAEFLALHPLAVKKPVVSSSSRDCKRTHGLCAVSSSKLHDEAATAEERSKDLAPAQLEPPPGLGRAQVSEPLKVATPARSQRSAAKKVLIQDTASQGEPFQVLLRGLPEQMTNEVMIRAMLDQANIEDGVLGVDTRPGGKVLVKFAEIHLVRQCIRHFHGRVWGSGEPVSALYVKTVKRSDDANTVQCGPPASANLSAEATAFVPAPTGMTFNPKASKFVPGPMKSAWASSHGQYFCSATWAQRGRFYSDASTEVGPTPEDASDEYDSDSDQVKELAACVAESVFTS